MKKMLNKTITIGAIALVALAIWDQLVRDPVHRTWQGSIFGFPYDFRPPTWNRVKQSFWSPDSDSVFSPHAFGVGWTLNAGKIFAIIRDLIANR